ncbi:uncharacterized protein LOC133422691 [Cololabis saira]|uniref:uncharacterized protein LOC133422691 n=1 Tax=Cololabis saira TaxID=129043 RepID=UPI002AD46E80|nr:uncharacterized protein LOC133422691 [Cololabis saira]
MMKMAAVIRSCCVALFLALTSVSAVNQLKTISDLKRIDFDSSVPKHSLLLLYWFADLVEVDNNNIIRVTFDPNQGDYGSHHYGNFERVLEPLPQGNGYRYYTVGNLNQDSSMQLPSYLVHPRSEYEGRNRDRIIFRAREDNTRGQYGQIIDRIYMTQHYETSDNQGTRYDPAHTYQVTTRLLNRVRAFSEGRNDMNSLTNLRDHFGSQAADSQLRHIRNSWGQLACLGLFLFIVIQEKHSSNHQNNKRQAPARRNPQRDIVHIPQTTYNFTPNVSISIPEDPMDELVLEVTTGASGKARIVWRNVPSYFKKGVMVGLYKTGDHEEALTYKSIGNTQSGSYNTSVPLNEGLQVRLHKAEKLCFFWQRLGEEIHRGEEFKNPTPVSIKGYKAHLQLFAKDGKACARLYVQRRVDWRSKFKDSWVGFYSSEDEDTSNYEWWQWQWSTKFKPSTDLHDFSYDVYEYHSGMTIAPGVQARLILRDMVEKTRTPCWGGMPQETHC